MHVVAEAAPKHVLPFLSNYAAHTADKSVAAATVNAEQSPITMHVVIEPQYVHPFVSVLATVLQAVFLDDNPVTVYEVHKPLLMQATCPARCVHAPPLEFLMALQ